MKNDILEKNIFKKIEYVYNILLNCVILSHRKDSSSLHYLRRFVFLFSNCKLISLDITIDLDKATLDCEADNNYTFKARITNSVSVLKERKTRST